MAQCPVRLGGVVFEPDHHSGPRWQDVLASQYALGAHGLCGCAGRGSKRLAIRAYKTGAFGLARFPNSGEEHATSCSFYAASPEKSGRQCYGSTVLSEGNDGLLRMSLSLGLSLSEPSLSPQLGLDQRSGRSQPRMSLLGLLHLLWQEADLHTWWPRMEGKRNLGLVAYLLRKSASSIKCGRDLLSEHLLIGAMKQEGGPAVRSHFALAASRDWRLLVPLVLPRWTAQAQEAFSAGEITGKPFFGLPHLRIEPALWNATMKRFSGALGHWRNGGTTVALAQVEPVANDRARIVAMAMMAVTADWIPVESSYEQQVADTLVARKRAFNKPLRYDARTDEVFPDFILLDAFDGRQVPMEVFGLRTEAYLARKAAKTAYYDRVFGVSNWWSWDATSSPLPPFPRR